jgi:hypothetical protein
MATSASGCMLWIIGIDRFIDKIEPDELKKADKDWFYDELLTNLGARLSQNNSSSILNH